MGAAGPFGVVMVPLASTICIEKSYLADFRGPTGQTYLL